MSANRANRRFEFQKRSQLLICTHNETLSVVAMCVCNPDRPPARIHGMSLIPSITPSLRNQKKLSCVWIFHDGPGRKIGNIDILSLIRCIRTRDHAFPAWDRNSIGQTSLCFFHIRG